MNFKAISVPHAKEIPPPASRLFGPPPRLPQGVQALGKREESAAAKPSHKEAKSPSSSCARWVNAVSTEKGGANGSSLGHFFDLSGSFLPIAPTTFDTDARSKGGETGEKALTHTRAQHRVSVFLPSRIESNSVVHNALRVKRSNILTHRKHHATTSASTLCR